jgi:hypothetical protein
MINWGRIAPTTPGGSLSCRAAPAKGVAKRYRQFFCAAPRRKGGQGLSRRLRIVGADQPPVKQIDRPATPPQQWRLRCWQTP